METVEPADAFGTCIVCHRLCTAYKAKKVWLLAYASLFINGISVLPLEYSWRGNTWLRIVLSYLQS
jgi:hypothetical protein